MGADANGDDIERLMAEGLDHYGQDRVERAVECWRQVLRLAPDHAEALDYLQSAGYAPREGDVAPAPRRAATGGAPEQALLLEAVDLARRGALFEAHELLETLAARRPDDLQVQGHLELLRSRLVDRFLERLGPGEALPCLRVGPEEMLRFNLPKDAGFLLSMVDGATSTDDIVALSGMDPFDALRILNRLLEARILEVPA